MDGKIGKRRLSPFSLDADITLAPRRRPFQNIGRTNVVAFAPTYHVESPRREKRALGRD
jgi:hypothetical protein